jgi:SAM-dependent methyltransferase
MRRIIRRIVANECLRIPTCRTYHRGLPLGQHPHRTSRTIARVLIVLTPKERLDLFVYSTGSGANPNDEELNRWFEANKVLFETAYLAGTTTPWQRSGVGLHTPRSERDWEVLRRPIADCVRHSGTFLDIGCANGYLLECLLGWTQERRLEMMPYGLDFSGALVALARKRLPQYAHQLFMGNAWDWSPPRRFDFVNSTLDYLPPELQEVYVHRLLERYV